MEEKIIDVTEKIIGDTLYIIESVVSSTAKEYAYEKLKRIILKAIEAIEYKESKKQK